MQQSNKQDLSQKRTTYQKIGYWIATLFFLLVVVALIYAFLFGL